MSAPNGELDHAGCISVTGLCLTGGKTLTRGKSPELYRLGRFLPCYFSSWSERSCRCGSDRACPGVYPRGGSSWAGTEPPGLGDRRGDPRPPQPVSRGPGAQGLISRIVISARVLTDVINGCESIQPGSGPRCVATTPFDIALPHPSLAMSPKDAEPQRWRWPDTLSGRGGSQPEPSPQFGAKAGSVLWAQTPRGLCATQQQEGGCSPRRRVLRGLSALARGVWQLLVLRGSRVAGAAARPCTPRPPCCGTGGQRRGGGDPQTPSRGGHGCAHLQGASTLGACREDQRPNPASFGQVHPKDTWCCGWAAPVQSPTSPNPAAQPRWHRAPFIPHRCGLSQGLAEQTRSAPRSEQRRPVV